MIIRQSTAVVIMFGSFVDKTDGVTLKTAMVSAIDHATTGIFLNKNGGAGAVRNGTPTASVYDAYGMYRVTLNTTDTNTVGHLRVSFAETATCLPVWIDLQVVEEAVYDVMYVASAGGPSTVAAVAAVAAQLPVALTSDGNIKADTLRVSGTVQTAGDIPARLPAALTADGNIKADTLRVNGTAQTAGDLAALINTVDDLLDTEVAAIFNRLGAPAGASMSADVAAIKADAVTLLARLIGTIAAGTHTAQSGDAFARLGAPVGASTSADIAAVQADTDNLQTRIPAALTADGNMKADALRVNGTAQTAGDLAALLTTIDDFIDTEVAAIKAKTDNLPASPAAVGSDMGVSAAGLLAINAEVDTALATAIPDSYSADGAQPSLNQAALEIRQQMQEQSISGTTGTVKKPNGSTTALTLTYNSATDPTAVTRAS